MLQVDPSFWSSSQPGLYALKLSLKGRIHKFSPRVIEICYKVPCPAGGGKDQAIAPLCSGGKISSCREGNQMGKEGRRGEKRKREGKEGKGKRGKGTEKERQGKGKGIRVESSRKRWKA